MGNNSEEPMEFQFVRHPPIEFFSSKNLACDYLLHVYFSFKTIDCYR